MSNRLFRIAIVSAALGTLQAGTPHAQSYPRVTGSSEKQEIDYDPAGSRNRVGGDRVVVLGSGENTTFKHLEPEYTQQSARGMVPVAIGSGESQSIVWVPAALYADAIAASLFVSR